MLHDITVLQGARQDALLVHDLHCVHILGPHGRPRDYFAAVSIFSIVIDQIFRISIVIVILLYLK